MVKMHLHKMAIVHFCYSKLTSLCHPHLIQQYNVCMYIQDSIHTIYYNLSSNALTVLTDWT